MDIPIPTQLPEGDREVALVALQRQISLGNVALAERNRLLVELHETGDYTQRFLVELLNGAALDVGDKPITEGAVQKAIRRLQTAGANW